MKTKPRRFRSNLIRWGSGILAAIAGIFPSFSIHADGCFVVPKFVWDKHKDVNEPTQKAIIAYDAGYEAMILQVKYDGPVEEFGWLIPAPNLPTVTEGSMECFYELSKYTQRRLKPYWAGRARSSSDPTTGQSLEPEPPVKVIEIKTVGAYRIAVLSAKDAGALEQWLAANGYYLPADKHGVIDSYVKQGWYFVAAKINISKTAGWQVVSGTLKTTAEAKASLKEKLSSGELRPLHLGFASDRCVFPLKISSINGKPSEVQIYLLSKEPLVEKRMFEIKMAQQHQWRTNMLARRKETSRELQAYRARFGGGISNLPAREEPDHELSDRSELNTEDLIPYGQVSQQQLPLCSKEMMLPDGSACWLMKQTWTFKPEEMEDLEFVPAIPVFVSALKEDEGAFAAANLRQLGTNGVSALLMATQSGNPAMRAHATAGLASMSIQADDPEQKEELRERLPALLKDSDPEVRFYAFEAAIESGGPGIADKTFELLRDDNPEVAADALSALSAEQEEMSKHLPLLHQMLKDTNWVVQAGGLRGLLNAGVTPSREELLPLFTVPRMEVAGAAVAVLQQKHVSCEEAKPLLQNSLWMARLMGLKIVAGNTNRESVELVIPLLRDKEQFVRVRARDVLADLTGQDFSADEPEHWEKWWADNKATFVVDPKQVQERAAARIEKRREAMRALREQSFSR